MSRNYEHKGLMGHGGINCPCCRPHHNMSKRSAKRFSNRITRRAASREIRREASEYLGGEQ